MTRARLLHACVALMVLAAVVLEVVTAIRQGPGEAGTMSERLTRLFSYFTIDSNLLVGATSAALVVDPHRDGRLFRVLRLDGLLCIVVTGIVYHSVLSGNLELSAAGAVSNFLLHSSVPIGAVAVWLLVGPRPRIDPATRWWSVALPLAWIVYTFTRGSIVGWYPYPFLDVAQVGLPRSLANTAVVAVIFLVLARVVELLERRLRSVPAPGQTSRQGAA